MSRIRHVRGSRLALAGVAVTGSTALLAAVLSPAAGAADRPTRSGAIEDAEAVLADRAGALGLTPAQETKVRDVVVDDDGTRHVRYDRTYHRLPVLGGDFVLHLNPDGTYSGTSRATKSALSLASVTPKVTAPKAADLAANLLRAAHLGETLKKLTAKPRLVVDALHGAPKLAWQTDAVAHDEIGNPVGRTVLTDATTGARIDAWDSMESASGDGKSLYGGTVPLETTASGSSYQLKDATRGGTYTGDAENKTDKCLLTICLTRAPATLFTDADNQWGTGAAADRSTVAVDAQYGTDVTWDYYKKVHGRDGIAGDGKGSFNRVHYGKDYNNAFWDDNCFCMTYGDGDGKLMGPLVSLDVAGHEMSHGVTSKTAALTYSGESGGLNEGTSDIFGTMVEYYSNNANDAPDYMIGEEIYVNNAAGTKALRYMFKPSLDGASPDCYSSGIGNLDVHYSSGVANHAFYLIAEGAAVPAGFNLSASQLVCNGNTSAGGIGRDAASKVWYRALTVYMTSSTNYAGARAATLQAAADLYGSGSSQYNGVASAWSAVGVN